MAVDLEKLRWAVEALRMVKDRKAELKATEELARDALEQALGDYDEGALDGHVVVTWRYIRTQRPGSAVPQGHLSRALRSCKRVTEVRRFTLVEDDE